ncbi:MAG: hypothetical protein V7739_09055 [Motiliproteus sp.]
MNKLEFDSNDELVVLPAGLSQIEAKPNVNCSKMLADILTGDTTQIKLALRWHNSNRAPRTDRLHGKLNEAEKYVREYLQFLGNEGWIGLAPQCSTP